MTRREAHKQILIAECELHRSQLTAEISELRAEVRSLASPVTILAALSALASSWLGRRRSQPEPPSGPAWMQALQSGASLVSAWWSASRRGRSPG